MSAYWVRSGDSLLVQLHSYVKVSVEQLFWARFWQNLAQAFCWAVHQPTRVLRSMAPGLATVKTLVEFCADTSVAAARATTATARVNILIAGEAELWAR